MLQNWLKVAFANYKKNGLATVINVFGLTIALTVFVITLLIWNNEASFEKWIPDKERTYLIENINEINATNKPVFNSNGNFQMLNVLKQYPEVENVSLYKISHDELGIANGKMHTFPQLYNIEKEFFNLFPLQIISGDMANPLKNENSIAISDKFSAILFGNKNPIYKQIEFPNMGRTFFITAVYKLPNTNTSIIPNALILFEKEEYQIMNESIAGYYGNLIVKLKTNNSTVIEQKLKHDYFDKLSIPYYLKQNASLNFNPLSHQTKIHFTRIDHANLQAKSDYIFSHEKSNYQLIITMFSLSLLLLALSIINFINLNTSIIIKRAKESGVRKALGAYKALIIKQLVMESFILCLLAFILALISSVVFLPFVSREFGYELPMHTPLVFYFWMLVVTIIISVICGIIPAYFVANFKAAETLKGNYATNKSNQWIRRSILLVQLSVSSFFIICALITYMQVKDITHKNLGFSGAQVLNIWYSDYKNNSIEKYNLIKDLLGKINGCEYVAYGQMSPASGSRSTDELFFNTHKTEAYSLSVDYNYFKTLKIDLASGRYFSPSFSSDTINSCIINQAFAKEININTQEVVGKPLSLADKIYTIIGVVNDFHFDGMDKKIKPAFFTHFLQEKKPRIRKFLIKISSNNIPQTINKMEEIWTTLIEKGYPMNYKFIDKEFAKYFEKSQRQLKIFSTLTIAVLLVSLLGLFALSSFMIQQRLREVAIRKTLGAESKELIFKLTKNYLILAATGVLISIPFAYYFMNKWLSGFAYRIDMPWMPYVLSFILLLALTFAVVSIKARAATKVKVIKWLKYE